jgi:NAD(P)-dependent dehydrogenase (short-subunit alcohol dehydrogenase family)
MNVNLRGAFFVAQEACKRMIAQGIPGSIINISSILGSRQGTNQTNYGKFNVLMWLSNFLTNVYTQGTAKAGLNYMTKNMALELNRSNIRINALAPGYFNTVRENKKCCESHMHTPWSSFVHPSIFSFFIPGNERRVFCF